MYKSIFITCLMCVGAFSCIKINEEISIMRNGEGFYKLVLDLSSLYSESYAKDLIPSIFGISSEADQNYTNLDSLVLIKDLPDTDKELLSDTVFWNKVALRYRVDDSLKTFVTSLELKFSHVNEISYLHSNFTELSKIGLFNLDSITIASGIFGPIPEFSFQKGRIFRKPIISRIDTTYLNYFDGESEETINYIESFLKNATHTTYYSFPNKVSRCSIPNSEIIDRSTVKVENSYISFLKDSVDISGEIIFK